MIEEIRDDLLKFSHNRAYHHYINQKAEQYIKEYHNVSNTPTGKDMEYIQDIRTPQKHYEDICKGWLVEDMIDYLFHLPTFQDLDLLWNNHDKDRHIRVARNQITSSPDFKIVYQYKVIPLEVQSQFKKHNFFHIKENKAKRLIEKGSSLVQVHVKNKEIYLFRPVDILLGNKTHIKAFGGKIGYHYSLDEIQPLKITDFINDLPKRIISLFGNCL